MNIGQVGDKVNLSPKTIRYYEEIELVKPTRLDNGYRDYSQENLHRLSFLQRSRSLGFSIDECRSLLSLWEDEQRSSADVKALVDEKIGEIDHKLNELRSLKATLLTLAKDCHADDKPNCPIIDSLAGDKIK